eukprot:TRINITY_DN11988_c0_g1_i2.p1 TRINITY_DN11988_c0_g1~~TRINITY_DN11988_c0_g1_i2.p1  ORF type:complete len:723 (-),score=114.10 TRINITY_DN11988_c0_g1_i2:12-2180(-)
MSAEPSQGSADKEKPQGAASSELQRASGTWSYAPEPGQVPSEAWVGTPVPPGEVLASSELHRASSTWSDPPQAQRVSSSDWQPNPGTTEATSLPIAPQDGALQRSSGTWSQAPAVGGTDLSWGGPAVAGKQAAPADAEGNLSTGSDSTTAGLQSQAGTDSLPPRGRALMRAMSTQGSFTSASSYSGSRPPLRRTQTVEWSGRPDGRLRPTRTASAERPKARPTATRSLRREAEERGSSLPPERAKEPEPQPSTPVRQPLARAVPDASLKRTISRKESQQVAEAIRPGTKLARVFHRDVRRQLRIVVAGLMGSGKSTLCRMLKDLLGGVWINQDEFAHCGRAAKSAFLAEIAQVAQDKRVPVLIVDKINTQVQLCLQRIQARGRCHRTLHGTDPKLRSILNMTARGVEPLWDDEAWQYAALYTCDMTMSPAQCVMGLLYDLDNEGLLGRFNVEQLVSQDRLFMAFKATQQAERALSESQDSSPSEARPRKKPAPLWLWELKFAPQAESALRELWERIGCSTAELHPAPELHCTLLYMGGGSDHEIACRHSRFQGAPEKITKLRQHLESGAGQLVELSITRVVWDERIAAAEVSGLGQLSANCYPHVTLALRERVPPRVSNELLARRTANEDLAAGLGPWLAELGLSQYETAVRAWCEGSGAATADELAENADDLADAVELEDEDQRARTRMLFAQSAPGEVQELLLDEPLVLRGKVHGRRRGE